MRALADGGVPVRVMQSPAAEWAALRQWTPSAMAAQLGPERVLREVIVSPTPRLVYYDHSKPVKEIPGLTPRLPLHMRRNVTAAVFFGTLANRTDPTYMYWVGQKAKRNLFRWMEEDLAPTAPFGLVDAGWEERPRGPDAQLPYMQTWVGKAGLTSVVHYDASHNVYVQLYGTKTFVLFPPEAASLFQICPFQHPGDGHSCLDWEQLEADAAASLAATNHISSTSTSSSSSDTVPDADLPSPRSGLTRRGARASPTAPAGWAVQAARVVHLRAGDVLYVPPYWLHHVVTTGTTEAISVSLISPSAPQALMRDVERYPLRYERGWTRAVRIRAVVALFHALLDAVGRRADAGPAQLLQARYAAWLKAPESQHAGKALSRDFSCKPPREEATAAIAAEAGRDIGALYAQVSDRGVQTLLLFNYLEAMAHWAVIDGRHIPAVLHLMAQQCP
jgi:hypothetical protein